MNIGRLRHRVTILRKTSERDGFGSEIVTWQPLKQCWAEIITEPGREYMSADQVKAETEIEVTLRYTPDITVKDRVEYAGKTYDIVSATDKDFKHRQTVLTCKEID